MFSAMAKKSGSKDLFNMASKSDAYFDDMSTEITQLDFSDLNEYSFGCNQQTPAELPSSQISSAAAVSQVSPTAHLLFDGIGVEEEQNWLNEDVDKNVNGHTTVPASPAIIKENGGTSYECPKVVVKPNVLPKETTSKAKLHPGSSGRQNKKDLGLEYWKGQYGKCLSRLNEFLSKKEAYDEELAKAQKSVAENESLKVMLACKEAENVQYRGLVDQQKDSTQENATLKRKLTRVEKVNRKLKDQLSAAERRAIASDKLYKLSEKEKIEMNGFNINAAIPDNMVPKEQLEAANRTISTLTTQIPVQVLVNQEMVRKMKDLQKRIDELEEGKLQRTSMERKMETNEQESAKDAWNESPNCPQLVKDLEGQLQKKKEEMNTVKDEIEKLKIKLECTESVVRDLQKYKDPVAVMERCKYYEQFVSICNAEKLAEQDIINEQLTQIKKLEEQVRLFNSEGEKCICVISSDDDDDSSFSAEDERPTKRRCDAQKENECDQSTFSESPPPRTRGYKRKKLS